MYAKITNNIIEKYPFNIRDLQDEFPNTSFPLQMTDESLQEYGVYKVQVDTQPSFNERTEYIELATTPSFVNGEAILNWSVVTKTQEQLAQDNTDMAKSVRATRDAKLAECDWTQVADAPVNKAVWATYRQALRDITAQEGFPWTITWPDAP